MPRVRFSVPLWALAAAALVLVVLARWDGAIGQRDAETIADARRLLALTKPFHAQIARLASERDSALAVAARARTAAQGLDTTIARLSADTTVIGLRLRFPTLNELLVSYERRDSTRLREILALQAAHAADARALRLAVPRVVDLEGSLTKVVAIADCHILGVKFLPRCPSRTLSFVIGTGVGVVVAVVVAQ
jgi:hypothetical protein